MNKPLIGTLALLATTLSLVFVVSTLGTNHRDLTSSVINSQAKTAEVQKTPDAKQLFGIIQSLNSQIGKVVNGEVTIAPVVTTKVNQQDIVAVSPAVASKVQVISGLAVQEVSAPTPVNSVQPTDQEKLKTLIVERKNFMLMLAKADANLFLVAGLSPDVLKKIPAELKSEVESSVTLTGKIEVLAVMDSSQNQKKNLYRYNVLVNQERASLYLTDDLHMASGGTFQIVGEKIEDIFVAKNSQLTVKTPPPVVTYNASSNPPKPNSSLAAQVIGAGIPSLATPTPTQEFPENHKTLVLLVNYQNSQQNFVTPPISSQQARDIVFNGAINRFYQEQSYGKVGFSGDVYGWYTLPIVCNLNNIAGGIWNNDVATLVRNNHIDLSHYNNVVVVNNCDIGNDQMTYSTASIGATIISDGNQYYSLPVSWIDVSSPSFDQFINHPFTFTVFDRLLSELLGFNLSLDFAQGLDCGTQTLSNDGGCNRILDGNNFDIMGGGINSLQFNAFAKELLGWVPAQNTLLITQSGRYTINSLESPLDSTETVQSRTQTLPQAPSKKFAKIKILNSEKTPYYLELRKGTGFDGTLLNNPTLASNQGGLLVNRVKKAIDGFTLPESLLLDMSPTVADWTQDTKAASLNVGQQFNDSDSGLTIGPVVSTNGTSITFDVTLQDPPCARREPLVGYPLIPQAVVSGDVVNVTAIYDNGDSTYCPSSPISIGMDLPVGWQQNIPLPNPVIAPPSDDADPHLRKDVTFTVPANTPSDEYTTTFKATNQTTNIQQSLGVNILVEKRPSLSGIDPSSGSLATPITLTGTDFSSSPLIWIYGSDGYDVVYGSSDGTSVTFNLPDTIVAWGVCNTPGCRIPTPLGEYQIGLSNSDFVTSNQSLSFDLTP